MLHSGVVDVARITLAYSFMCMIIFQDNGTEEAEDTDLITFYCYDNEDCTGDWVLLYFIVDYTCLAFGFVFDLCIILIGLLHLLCLHSFIFLAASILA